TKHKLAINLAGASLVIGNDGPGALAAGLLAIAFSLVFFSDEVFLSGYSCPKAARGQASAWQIRDRKPTRRAARKLFMERIRSGGWRRRRRWSPNFRCR